MKGRELFVVVVVVIVGIVVIATERQHAGASNPNANQHYLPSSEYEALKTADLFWRASFLALLDRIQSIQDMQFDIAVIIQATTPRHPPGGACGTELTTYLRLLHRYRDAVNSGAAYGPPRFVTISRAEQRVVEACKPAPAHE